MGETGDETGRARPVRLWNRDFRLLWQGQFVSQVGNQAFSLAMMYWLMEETGSATLMGFMMMASMLPGVLLGPVGGTFADRHSRKSIIVSSDLFRGIAVLMLAAVIFAAPDATGTIVAMLFAVSVLNGIVGAAFNPAISAAIPDLVPRDRIAAANSLTQLGVRIAMLTGQAAGGALYRILGSPLLFAIDGISYLLSACSEAFIRLPEVEKPVGRRSGTGTLAAYLDDTIVGMRYILEKPGMGSLLMISAAINFLAMPVIVLLPFFVSLDLGAGAEWYGLLLASLGAGSLASYLVLSVARIAPARRPAVVASSMLAVGVAFALLGATRAPVISLLLMFATGVGTGFINVISMSHFQLVAPAAIRGRVLSMVYTLAGAASPLGMAAGGLLGDLTDKNTPAICLGSGLAIIAVGLLALSRRAIREFLALEPG